MSAAAPGGGAASRGGGRIGPNALLQLVPVLERQGGPALRQAVFEAGGVRGPIDRRAMVPEGAVACVHQAMRRLVPGLAPGLATAAGTATGDYILAHRIPRAVQVLLRHLPRAIAADLLARAVAGHAWTFAGSGRFSRVRADPPLAREGGRGTWPAVAMGIFARKKPGPEPVVFEIAGNPLVDGERAGAPVCHWHAAVFQRLFAVLVDPGVEVRETACCACGAPACRFEIRRPR